MKPKYILLRGIEHGNRFFSAYVEDSVEEACKLATGETAYEFIAFADSAEQAQCILYGHPCTIHDG